MPSREVTLAVAEFLDSRQAAALAGVPEPDRRRIAELFLAVAYDELGKKPRLFDEADLTEALAERLPRHLGRRDRLAEHVPAVLYAFLAHLEESQVVTQAFELRRALDGALDAFAAAVESGHLAHTAGTKQAPVVHKAPKLGRNDPCSCGSGKKFKHCHGR